MGRPSFIFQSIFPKFRLAPSPLALLPPKRKMLATALQWVILSGVKYFHPEFILFYCLSKVSTGSQHRICNSCSSKPSLFSRLVVRALTLRAVAEWHRASTFAIVARNVAAVEVSSTSATFHATIALCLPPATLHAMVWCKRKLFNFHLYPCLVATYLCCT